MRARQLGPAVLRSGFVNARVQRVAVAPEAENERADAWVVEHYRLDASRALSRALGTGAFVVTLGAVLMGVAILVPRLDPSREARPMTARAAIFRGQAVTADGTPVPSQTTAWELALAGLGLICVAGGSAWAILGLRTVMSEESYLALRNDGAYFRHGRERSLLPWEEVETVRWDPEARAVVFVRHDGSTWVRAERFAGTEGSEIAKRASEVRRKALFGLLR